MLSRTPNNNNNNKIGFLDNILPPIFFFISHLVPLYILMK